MMQPAYYQHQYPCHTNFPTSPSPYAAVNQIQQSPVVSRTVSAGIFGMMVVSSGTLGADLHNVADGHMTIGEAVGHSVANGIAGGAAAAVATAAASSLTRGGVAGVAVTLAAGTVVSYLINKMNR